MYKQADSVVDADRTHAASRGDDCESNSTGLIVDWFAPGEGPLNALALYTVILPRESGCAIELMARRRRERQRKVLKR